MFLIVGVPGYFEPNPVIAIRVAIGAVIGLIVVVYRFQKKKQRDNGDTHKG
jgi:hypothetical protein